MDEAKLYEVILNELDDVLCIVLDPDKKIISPKDSEKLNKYQQIIKNPTNVPQTFFIKQTGEWFELKEKFITIANIAYRIQYFHNVTKYKENEQSLQRDNLTGIDNRENTIFHINEYIMYALKNNEEFSFLIADVDHFKDINDTYGHLFGDEVLRNIGNLIRHNMRHEEGRAEDIAGRFGGDEFFGVIRNISREATLDWIERADFSVKDLIHVSTSGNDTITDVKMSIGMYHVSKKDIAEFNASSLTIDQIRKIIFERCDQALYKVKNARHSEEKEQSEIDKKMLH